MGSDALLIRRSVLLWRVGALRLSFFETHSTGQDQLRPPWLFNYPAISSKEVVNLHPSAVLVDFLLAKAKKAENWRMWKCSKCNEQHADHFSSCWKCAGMDAPPKSVPVASLPSMMCVRCETELDFVGTKRFQDDSAGGVWGAFGELFAKRQRFDVYACPRCGRVEFFVDGVGEEYRAEGPATRVPRTAESTVERMYNEAAHLASHGDVEEAVARFELVITRYPGTNYARSAEEKIRVIKEKLGI